MSDTPIERWTRVDGFLPLRGYALLADGRSCALVGAGGAIDWWALSMAGDPAFGALLDPHRGGSLTLRPVEEFEVSRCYAEGGAVLTTLFHTSTGSARITDALTLGAYRRCADAGTRRRGGPPQGAAHDRALVVLADVDLLRRALAGGGRAQRHRPQAAHAGRDRCPARRRHYLAARTDRWQPEHGLPVLLGAGHRVRAGCVVQPAPAGRGARRAVLPDPRGRSHRTGCPGVLHDGWHRSTRRDEFGTIDAIRSELSAGGALLYRYSGMSETEGAFIACSFWWVEALAIAGRLAEAREVMDAMVEQANDVGLLTEEIDPGTGELLGNMPQLLSHLALISAATAYHARAR